MPLNDYRLIDKEQATWTLSRLPIRPPAFSYLGLVTLEFYREMMDLLSMSSEPREENELRLKRVP